MQQSVLLEVLCTLTEEERKAFGNYLELPIIKKGKQLQQLLKELLPLLPQEKLPDQWQKNVWDTLYDLPFDNKQFNTQLSQLKKQAEQYLVLIHLQEDSIASKQLLTEIFQQRKATTAYKIAFGQLQNQLLEQPTQDIRYYQNSFALYHHLHLNPNLPSFSNKDDHAEKAMDNLDRLFVLGKLRYSCELLAKQKIFKKEIAIQLLDEAVELASTNWGKDHPLFCLYTRLLFYHRHPTESKGFSDLVLHFQAHLSLLSRWEQNFILIHLINLANWRNELQIEGFEQLLYDVHKIGFNTKLIVIDGILPDTLFSNFVLMGLKLKEFDFINTFIREYQTYLPPTYREAAVTLSRGYWYFYTKKFQETFDTLANLKKHNQSYDNRGRTLETLSLFEIYLMDKTYHGLLTKRISSFQRHINRQKKRNELSSSKHTMYKNLFKMVKVIIRHIVQQKTTAPYKIKMKAQLENSKPIVAYSWLLEKIEGL